MKHKDPIFYLGNANLQTYAMFAAHELGLFEVLKAQKKANIDKLAQALDLQLRPAQALVSLCAACGLIKKNEDESYALTDDAEDFLVSSGDYYWGPMLNVTLKNPLLFSYDHFKKALRVDHAQVYGEEKLFEQNEQSQMLAQAFTHAMHSKSKAAAVHWPTCLDLSEHRHFLDIAGGSGVHAQAALKANPLLHATVFERPAVAQVAKEYGQKAEHTERLFIHVGDMWQDEFPKADVHFYCDVFHDWPYDKCLKLAQKSFRSLPPNGRILVHELLFTEGKTSPLSTALYNMVMMMWTDGQQLSKSEITGLLIEAGFSDVTILPTGFGDWSLVSGRKL